MCFSIQILKNGSTSIWQQQDIYCIHLVGLRFGGKVQPESSWLDQNSNPTSHSAAPYENCYKVSAHGWISNKTLHQNCSIISVHGVDLRYNIVSKLFCNLSSWLDLHTKIVYIIAVHGWIFNTNIGPRLLHDFRLHLDLLYKVVVKLVYNCFVCKSLEDVKCTKLI